MGGKFGTNPRNGRLQRFAAVKPLGFDRNRAEQEGGQVSGPRFLGLRMGRWFMGGGVFFCPWRRLAIALPVAWTFRAGALAFLGRPAFARLGRQWFVHPGNCLAN